MMNGTAPPPPRPPPPDHIYPDKDTDATIEACTDKAYNDDELWTDPPEYLPPGPHDSGRHARRSANHSAYRINGHPTIWKNYLIYGYYMYDDCHDFMKAWKATALDRLERQRFIWREYHYRRINGIHIGTILQKRVTEKTMPYLKEHDPDLWMASDMEYEEVMFFNGAENLTSNAKDPNSGTDPEGQWQEVSPKRRNKKSSPSPSSRNTASLQRASTEIPTAVVLDEASGYAAMEIPAAPTYSPTPNQEVIDVESDKTPPRRISNPYNPLTNPTKNRQSESSMDIDPKSDDDQHTSNEHSQPRPPRSAKTTLNKPKTSETKSYRTGTVFTTGNSTIGNGSHGKSTISPVTPINDGTYRLTVRWKPANYSDIYANQDLWDANITEILAEIFGEYIDTVTLIKWDDTTQKHTSSFEKIKDSGEIAKFLSPRITHLESSEQFIFGLRISMSESNPSRWINDGRTKRTMQENFLTISISNSKTNSGDVVTAGHILLKHPEYTNRTYYLMSLRRSLPESTPFFDIGLVYTTPHGEKIPHLIVKCGSNHATALNDVLSAYLDGKKTTALFLATSMLQTMTTEEAHGLFATHKKFIASIQRLPLFPQVVNIDRIRTEYHPNSNPIERSTREWATGLRSSDNQQLLRCDAENGGKDRRAYLLVPTAFLDQAKMEYEQYKHRLKQSGYFRTPHSQHDNPGGNDRPQEIYIPTAAVLRNLQFMQHMSSESIWKAAPPIRPITTYESTQTKSGRNKYSPPIDRRPCSLSTTELYQASHANP